MRVFLAIAGLSLLACTGASAPVAPPATQATQQAPVVPAAPVSAAPVSAAPVSTAPVVPAAPVSAAPMCENARLLTQYTSEELANGTYCKVCAGVDQHACVLDWPSSDVPSCEAYDQMRNGIYAFYGRPFETPKWKAYFAGVSWYKADPTYTDARLSKTAVYNIELLKRKAANKEGCM